MSRRNVELIRASYEAFDRGDIETAFALMTDDIVAYDDPRMVEDPVYIGRDGFAHMLELTTEGFEDVRYFFDDFNAIGESVLVDARRCGRGASSGIMVEEHQYHLWDLRDGRAYRFRLFLSRADAVQAAAHP